MFKEFSSIEDLVSFVAFDKQKGGALKYIANRYPVRFVLFDNLPAASCQCRLAARMKSEWSLEKLPKEARYRCSDGQEPEDGSFEVHLRDSWRCCGDFNFNDQRIPETRSKHNELYFFGGSYREWCLQLDGFIGSVLPGCLPCQVIWFDACYLV